MAKRAATEQTYREEAHVIAARDVKFTWDDVPLHYVPNEPFASQFWNIMHLIVPEGEKAMAGTVSEALPYITDERLHEEAVGFIGQEAMHAVSHESYHDRLAEQGIDIEPILRNWEFWLRQVLTDHALPARAKKAWLNERLAMFAAFEHFTAIVGQWLLDNEALAESGTHPMMLDILKWHGAEEVEHRNVLFDVYQHVDGSYARRVRTAILAGPGLAVWWLGTAHYLMKQDPAPKKWWRPWPVQLKRAAKAGLIPDLSFFVTELPPYLRRDFHPSEMGPLDAAVKYLATSPAALAAEH
ncbi:metal-dependent hydrolase [Nocardia huaxiensis]|uniref:metal-dependent hydrolase n=1 Tax=Nocardia huaxiensis TaxID=2755382 RepID=UPI001E399946|nr:metal-dependent hydrolase [Nocardia huaxiensis]UFS98536.1 metal-dependent hydrolase [Nocardia huaxiensis]